MQERITGAVNKIKTMSIARSYLGPILKLDQSLRSKLDQSLRSNIWQRNREEVEALLHDVFQSLHRYTSAIISSYSRQALMRPSES